MYSTIHRGLYSTYFMSMSAVIANFRPLSLTDLYRLNFKDGLGTRGRLDYMKLTLIVNFLINHVVESKLIPFDLAAWPVA